MTKLFTIASQDDLVSVWNGRRQLVVKVSEVNVLQDFAITQSAWKSKLMAPM